MKLSFQPYKLKLKHPFKLAYGTRTETDIVLLEIEHKGLIGYGEASLPPYLNETLDSVAMYLSKLDVQMLNPYKLKDTIQYLDELDSDNNAAKAAVDIALHDLLGKLENKSLAELLGIDTTNLAPSSYTIGMSSLPELKAKLEDASDYPLIKLKLGGKNDKELVSSYISSSAKPFYVDVNQGWKDKEFAMDMAAWLTEKGALFIEQPMPIDMIDETAQLTENSSIPIIADESVRRLADLTGLRGVFSGVNIKLMKSTGIFEALQMMNTAREMGFKVLVGCMAESSCAVTAAANLAPLADWADLDGPALISNDPFTGVKMKDGKLIIPSGIGLGIERSR